MDDDDSRWPRVIGAGLLIAILLLSLGYLGWLHPLGDSLSVGRALAALAVLVLSVAASFVGLRMAAFGGLLLAMLTGAQVFLAYNWPGPPGRYLVYQKNMLFKNDDLPGLEADIRATGPQIVTLQEVSDPNLALLAALKDIYPYQLVCEGRAVGGTAIVTALPPVPGTEVCGPGLAVMQVVSGEDRFWVVSVHLQWPWPYSQSDHVTLLEPILSQLKGPAIMAGDFNMVRWAYSVKRLADSLDVRPGGPMLGTFQGLSSLYPLAIDHVFSTRGGRVTLRDLFGSDHNGLLAEMEI